MHKIDLTKKGVTLMELIVMVVIIAILAAIVAPNAFRAIEKAKISQTVADMKAVKTAVYAYTADIGSWPASHYIKDSTSRLLRDDGKAGWDGPYLDSIPFCPLMKRPFPLMKPPTPSCYWKGYYFIAWEDDECSSGGACNLFWDFDLDKDGVAEVQDGVSISVFGYESLQQIIKVDAVFDGEGIAGIWPAGRIGSNNASLSPLCSGYGQTALYIGNSGVSHPD